MTNQELPCRRNTHESDINLITTRWVVEISIIFDSWSNSTVDSFFFYYAKPFQGFSVRGKTWNRYWSDQLANLCQSTMILLHRNVLFGVQFTVSDASNWKFPLTHCADEMKCHKSAPQNAPECFDGCSMPTYKRNYFSSSIWSTRQYGRRKRKHSLPRAWKRALLSQRQKSAFSKAWMNERQRQSITFV